MIAFLCGMFLLIGLGLSFALEEVRAGHPWWAAAFFTLTGLAYAACLAAVANFIGLEVC